MKREQLEHAIRAACQIISQPAVIVVGSQSILGTYDEHELPQEATMSRECDILPIADTNDETARLADVIEGVAGEWSPFEAQHGFSIDGVDLTTVVLPAGWRDRLVKVQTANTAAPSGDPRFTGWCLEPHDLCAAKLCAGREKDLNFVRALLGAGLIDGSTVAARLASIPSTHVLSAQRAAEWLASTNRLRGDIRDEPGPGDGDSYLGHCGDGYWPNVDPQCYPPKVKEAEPSPLQFDSSPTVRRRMHRGPLQSVG